MNHDVFISYKSQDLAVAKAVAHILEDVDIHCWYAPQNLDKRSAGKRFDDVIVDAIKAAKIVVVLLSDESLESRWVNTEVTCAENHDKLIIPFVIRELSVDNGLYNRLNTTHKINAFPSPNKKFDVLQSNVTSALNQGTGEGRIIQKIKNHTDIYDMDFDEGEALYAAKEYIDAIRSFLRSAENGNAEAKSRLCEIFYDIYEIDEILPEDMWVDIEKLAKEGHAYANFLMHTKYHRAPDCGLISFEYLKRSLSEGPIAEAFMRLGIHYAWGIGVNHNHTLALHYYQKALDMGKTDAYGYLGSEYLYGNDKVEKDIDKAIEYFEKGVEAKCKRALRELHMLYNDGIYQDIDQAIYYAQKAIECGHNEGYVWLGDTYSNIIKDNATAKKWYIEAAKKDVKGAYTALANIYWEDGQKEKAFQMAHRGVANRDSRSYETLGWFYENNSDQSDDNGEPQFSKAWKYYKLQYSVFGNRADHLARLYLEYGYRPDEEENYKLDDLILALEVCARNSSEICIDYLVNIHLNPEEYKLGISRDMQRIKEYVNLGARLGFAKYMYREGLKCLNSSNPYKGIEWLEKGAAKYDSRSVSKLLDVYGKDGIEADPILYDHWCDYAIVNNLASPTDNRFIDFIERCIENQGEYKAHYNVYLIYAQSQEGVDAATEAKILALWEKGVELENAIYSKIVAEASLENTVSEETEQE